MYMNPTTKELILRDYTRSGKDLGEFALDWMKVYDDMSYELVLVDAEGKHGKLVGTAVMDSYDKILDLISLFQIRGDYKIRIVDCQREFFCILAQIRDELNNK